MGKNGREYAIEQFNKELMYRRHIEMYNEVLNKCHYVSNNSPSTYLNDIILKALFWIFQFQVSIKRKKSR